MIAQEFRRIFSFETPGTLQKPHEMRVIRSATLVYLGKNFLEGSSSIVLSPGSIR